MILLSLLLLAKPQPQVTLSMIGDVRLIAGAVSRASGVPITIAKDVPSRTLTVIAHAKPLSELVQRMAYVMYCKATPVAGGFRLDRDLKTEAESVKAYREWRDATYKRADLERVAEYLNKPFDAAAAKRFQDAFKSTQPPTSGDMIEKQALAEELPRPITRMLASLLHDIPVSKWQKPDHDLVAFSNQPKPSEGLITVASFQAALRRYREDEKVEGTHNAESVDRVVLMLRRTRSPNDQSEAEIALLNEDGALIERTKMRLVTNWHRPSPPPELLARFTDTEPVPPSHYTKAYNEAARGGKPDKFMVARVHDPVRYDPQDLLQGDVWRAIAQHTGKDLVLNLPDEWVVYAPTRDGRVPPLKEALKMFWSRLFRVESQWITYRLLLPDPSYFWRFDREALKDAIAAFRKSDGSQIYAAAKFAYKSHLDGMPGQLWGYLDIAHAGGLVMLVEDGQSQGFREFFGSLTLAQQKRWLEGGTVQEKELSPVAKGELTRWIERNGVMPTDGRQSRIAVQVLPEVSSTGISGVVLGRVNQMSGVAILLPDRWMAVAAIMGQ